MSKSQREDLRDRLALRAPLLKLSIDEETDIFKKEPSWINGIRNAIALQRKPSLQVVLIFILLQVRIKLLQKRMNLLFWNRQSLMMSKH